MALYWPVPESWSCPRGTDLLQNLCRRKDNVPLRKKVNMDTSSCYPLHVLISFTLLELFPQMWVKENDEMIPQSVPLEHKRFVIRGWRPPTCDLSQEGIWKGNRHGANQTPPWRKEDVWCLQKHHPLTYNSTSRGTMGLFHQNYCMNQHNTGNKYLAGIKVVQKTYFGSMPLSKAL